MGEQNSRRWRGSALAAALVTMATAGAALWATDSSAQTVEERVGGHRDWSVYEHGSGASRVCWVATTPKSWRARRGGADVTGQVRRGEIFLNVAIRPSQNVANEISFIAGYPLRSNGAVRVTIGGDGFEMFSDGETAWLENAAADNSMVTAMKAGTEARVVGVSARGTETTDTFSLLGFTAALDDAARLCSG
jgi:hypothetical protein